MGRFDPETTYEELGRGTFGSRPQGGMVGEGPPPAKRARGEETSSALPLLAGVAVLGVLAAKFS